MLFGNELSLEQHWRRLIEERISSNTKFTILAGKKVADIVICREDNPPIAFFLEFKINLPYKPGKRMAIPEGFQQEILRGKPSYFGRYLRWIICNDTDSEKRYIFATNDVIREGDNLRGGSMGDVGEKTVNISPKIFDHEEQLTEDELLDAIAEFLETD